MAFILTAVAVFITLLLCALVGFANGMSDAPSVQGTQVFPIFAGGMLLAAIIAASHWLPHIGW